MRSFTGGFATTRDRSTTPGGLILPDTGAIAEPLTERGESPWILVTETLGYRREIAPDPEHGRAKAEPAKDGTRATAPDPLDSE